MRGATIQGHQVHLSDILDAPHDSLGLLMPRRSFKTSTLFAKAIGRIAEREDYFVAYTMTTTAIKARQRFRDDIVRPLEGLFPDPRERPFHLNKAGGSERVEWRHPNGATSVFAFLAPKGDAFRSDAWDWIILDEAGQAKPDMGEDILDGAAATQDTRPGSHITFAGTGPKYREGNLLWDELEKGRAGEEGHSILDYSAPQTLTTDDVDEWPKARAVIIDIHPVIGTTTDEAAIRKSYSAVGPASFLREYCGVADTSGEAGFFDMTKWAAGEQTGEVPVIPAHHRVGFAVDPLGMWAAFVAVWRDDLGHPCLLVIGHRAGTKWAGDCGKETFKRLRTPIIYDSGSGSTVAAVDAMKRLRNPMPRFEGQTWPQVSAAAALLKTEMDDGNVRHWGDEELTRAVSQTKKRTTGDAKRWALGRVNIETDDITLVEAASIALRAYDEAKPRKAYKKPSFAA
ncbi:hypothetical protein GCM10027515_26630 [Schumannella luteola]